MERISLLIVDDNPVIRKGLRSILEGEKDILVQGEAGSGKEVLQQLRGSPVDMVLLDIRMPEQDGIETAAAILAVRPECKILMLTVVEDPLALLQSVLAGAKGYLVYGHFAPEELAPAIRTVYSGGAIITPVLATALLRLVAEALGGTVQLRADIGDVLTPREQEILKLIARGKTNAQIAKLLQIKEKTVKNCINSIYSKLHLKGRKQAAAFALASRIWDLPSREG